MVEQLDLFIESARKEEPAQEKKEPIIKNKLTTRQWQLLNFIKNASFNEHRKVSQKDICNNVVGYEWNDDPKCHDHCVPIWNDIKDINLSYETDKLIISDNFEYWVGDEQETQEFLDKLWNDLSPRLVRYWAYLKKVARNGQGQLFSRKLQPIDDSSKARNYIESYGETRISGD